ncbi:MAG: RNA pseudouridine synthase [Lachnospiraceae bacterium]|nr:RNA pseudouridine synthase [Lachnospiraceae bacterium]
MDIIFEDDAVIVIHKPAGIAVQSGRVGDRDIVSDLKKYLKSDYAGIVHRLDQPVEGLMIFGKTQAAASALSAQIRDVNAGTFNKRYDVISLIKNKEINPESRLVDLIAVDRLKNLSYITDDKALGKEAVLDYTVKEQWEAGMERYAHIMIDLFTGRRHQIRIQLANAGMPVVGDRKYGYMPTDYRGNICLAASQLSFRHPVTDTEMKFEIIPGFLQDSITEKG